MNQLNLIGTTLGHFEILAEVGRGGMAMVYRARQINLDRIVALKVLPPELTYDTSNLIRFNQEARSAARLEHHNIVPIYEIGAARSPRNVGVSLHYIAMKYISGRTLKDLLEQEGVLSLQHTIELMDQIAMALDYAHQHGVIHRDIKPSNIMVTDDGWVYLTDFGLARWGGSRSGDLTLAGTVVGTPEYMSPEQAQGGAIIGPGTDIYALGVVLYELLTGALPFEADTPMAMLAARLVQTPRPPREIRHDLTPPVEAVIMRTLARNPEERYPNASALTAALHQAVGIPARLMPARPITPSGGMPSVLTTTATPVPNQGLTNGLEQTMPYVLLPNDRPAPSVEAAPTEPISAAPAPPWSQDRSARPQKQKGPSTSLIVIGIGIVILILVLLFDILIATQQPEGSESLAPVAISSNNPQVVALLRSGNEALAKEDGIAAAISAYQQALELEPNNTDALTSLAIAYNLRGDWPNTEVQATALISATGGVGSAAALGHALLADALASLGGNKQALEEANKAIQLDSQLSLAYGIKSNALANLAVSRNEPQLMEQALDAVQQANVHITDEGDLYKAMTHNAIGFTYGQLSKYNDDPQALEIGKQEFIQATIIQSQIALFHSNLGYFYLNQQLYDLSRGEFDKAKQLDAGFAHAHTGLGLSYLLERNNDQAIQAFDEALKINPNDYEPYYGRGKALIAQGKYPEAAQSLSTATELNPRFDELYAWLGEAYIGIRYVSTDETTRKQAVDRAFEAYQKALALNDRSAMALTGLGWALQYQGSYDQSIEQFRQSLAIDETQYEAHNGLGWSLYNRGIAIANAGNEAEAAQNFEEAGGNFLRATQLKIDYDDAFLGLGHTLVRRGLLEDAKKAYEAAVGFNSDNTEARAALNRLLQQQQP